MQPDVIQDIPDLQIDMGSDLIAGCLTDADDPPPPDTDAEDRRPR